MPILLHSIQIDAPLERVYQAITTSEGLQGWWTEDSEAEEKVGGEAGFGFGGRATYFRMRIDELKPGERVAWTCLGDVDEWTGTTLAFDLAPGEEGGTLLRFSHDGWRSTEGWLAVCNTTWGHLMYFLKDYSEGRGSGPLFRESQD